MAEGTKSLDDRLKGFKPVERSKGFSASCNKRSFGTSHRGGFTVNRGSSGLLSYNTSLPPTQDRDSEKLLKVREESDARIANLVLRTEDTNEGDLKPFRDITSRILERFREGSSDSKTGDKQTPTPQYVEESPMDFGISDEKARRIARYNKGKKRASETTGIIKAIHHTKTGEHLTDYEASRVSRRLRSLGLGINIDGYSRLMTLEDEKDKKYDLALEKFKIDYRASTGGAISNNKAGRIVRLLIGKNLDITYKTYIGLLERQKERREDIEEGIRTGSGRNAGFRSKGMSYNLT